MNRTICALIFVLLLVAFSAPAQAPQADSRLLVELVDEVQAQQKQITQNQAAIDEQLADLAEAVRVARIYAGRSGR